MFKEVLGGNRAGPAATLLSAAIGLGACSLAKASSGQEQVASPISIRMGEEKPPAPPTDLGMLTPPARNAEQGSTRPGIAASTMGAPVEKELKATHAWLAALSAFITIPGYVLALRRGTSPERREKNPIFRALDRIYPETQYFANNRATWIASGVNSAALFGLGMLQALSAKASLLSALSSQAVVGVYALGASVLAAHAIANGKASTLKPTDKLCLAGALCGVAAFVGASLSRFGYLPPSSLPLEGIGIALGLTVRALALTPLTREFISCGRHAFDPQSAQHSKSIPSLASHFFWNGAIMLNLLNLPSFISKAAIVPVGMTCMNMVTFAAGIWAWRRLRSAHRTQAATER
jgi:hypothetical protein